MMRALFAFSTAMVAVLAGTLGWRNPETRESIDGPEYLRPLDRPEVAPNGGRVIAIAEAKRLRKNRARLARKRL